MKNKIILSTVLLVLIHSFAFGSTPSLPTDEITPDNAKPVLSIPDKGAKIIGKWKWTLPDSSCSETYIFKPDGTTSVTSGEERSESVYRIASVPTTKGFFVMTDKITQNNGGKDCTGDTTPIGDEVTMYISFDSSGESLIVCKSESFDTCFGPLKRVKE